MKSFTFQTNGRHSELYQAIYINACSSSLRDKGIGLYVVVAVRLQSLSLYMQSVCLSVYLSLCVCLLSAFNHLTCVTVTCSAVS